MDKRKLLAAYLIWRAAKRGRGNSPEGDRGHTPEGAAGGGMGIGCMAVWLALGALLGAVLIWIFR